VRHESQFTFDVPFIKAALRRDILWKGYVAAGLMLVLAPLMRWLNGFWDPWMTGGMVLLAGVFAWRIRARSTSPPGACTNPGRGRRPMG
jgi:hypothetical protein